MIYSPHKETYYGKTNNRDTKTIEISRINSTLIEQIIDKNLRIDIINHNYRRIIMSLADKCRKGVGKGIVYSYPCVDFRMIKLYLPSEENFEFFKNLCREKLNIQE